MPSLGPMELIIIFMIVVMVFGAGKLTSVGGALGSSIKEFKHSVRDDDEEEIVAVESKRKAQIEQL